MPVHNSWFAFRANHTIPQVTVLSISIIGPSHDFSTYSHLWLYLPMLMLTTNTTQLYRVSPATICKPNALTRFKYRSWKWQHYIKPNNINLVPVNSYASGFRGPYYCLQSWEVQIYIYCNETNNTQSTVGHGLRKPCGLIRLSAIQFKWFVIREM